MKEIILIGYKKKMQILLQKLLIILKKVTKQTAEIQSA